MRSSLAAGVALVGAAVVVVTPLPVPSGTARAASTAYGLTAASTAITGASLSNVPVNLFNMVMSTPAWEVEAMGRLADAMIATGSWQVWGPTNVLGFDEQDPPKLAALIDMLVPIRPLSSALGDQLSWSMRANLPMNSGCAAAPSACPDPMAMLSSMFTVPAAELSRGYQFPAVTNPFTGQPTSWSGQYVKLDRGAASTSLRRYLTGPPVGVQTVSPADALDAAGRLAKSVKDAFNPFVQNSQWFDTKHTVFAPLFRALAPALCASCGTNPYDNEWLNSYSQKPAAVASLPAAPAATKPVTAATQSAVPPTPRLAAAEPHQQARRADHRTTSGSAQRTRGH